MDSVRPETGRRHSLCSCFDCLVPVRCIIDQHEVEIIPASARSTTSNEYSARGALSSGYNSSSYRQQQLHQLSQRAAAVDLSPRQGNLFSSSINPPEQQQQQPASYRSAAAASDIFTQSRQASWDTKAPRVPLINLRKMQEHGAALSSSSPPDSERLLAAAAVYTPQTVLLKDIEKNEIKRNHNNEDSSNKEMQFNSIKEQQQEPQQRPAYDECKEVNKEENVLFSNDECFKKMTSLGSKNTNYMSGPGASLFNNTVKEEDYKGEVKTQQQARSGLRGVCTDIDSFPLLGLEYSLCIQTKQVNHFKFKK